MYTFTGYNVCNGHLHVRKFTDSELHLGLMIRSLRSFLVYIHLMNHSLTSVLYINLISYLSILLLHLFYWCVNNNNNNNSI